MFNINNKQTQLSIICLTLLFFAERASAQNRGYVQSDVIKVASVTTDDQITGLTVSQKQTSRIFMDGLGRPIQTVTINASPLQKDIILPIAYDNIGRQTKAFLPYVGSDGSGSFRPNAVSSDQPGFYNNGVTDKVADDTSPFSQQVFETSPLQRVLASGLVGANFQPTVAGNHYKSVNYRANSLAADGNLLQWETNGTFTSGTFYAANSLSVTDGKDEANVETLTFTDIAGHVVLKRQVLAGANLDTYYVYNSAGLLSFVIPPKATALLSANSYNLSSAPLNNLIFKYVYDAKGRLVEKTTPSSGVVYIIYDPLNRPVLVQDAKLRLTNQWNYIKYDAKDHPVSQGLYADNTTTPTSHIGRVNMQNYVSGISGYTTAWFESRSATASTGYYTNIIFPTTNLTPLGYSYYDDYDLDGNGTPNYSYQAQSLANENKPTTDPSVNLSIKGVPTMVQVRSMGSGLSDIWLIKVQFYDKQGHLIQTQSNNQINYTAGAVTDYSTSAVSFEGVTTQTKIVKSSGTPALPVIASILTTLTYDHVNRLKAIDQSYNGGAVVHVASYAYNELGQLVDKKLQVNGAACLQSVDYRYNIRAQLLSINNSKLSNDAATTNTNDDSNDLFGMQMLYDKVDAGLSNNAYFNGKLSAVKWISKNASGASTLERSFKYSYDAADRYNGATYAERAVASTGTFDTNINAYNENNITYDENGNLLSLNRTAITIAGGSSTPIDNLGYIYDANNPNQLKTVTDGTGNGLGFRNFTGTTTGTYIYDENGNLTNDPYKGLTIAYNQINRTDKITVVVPGLNGHIDYTYNANGTMLRKDQYTNTTLTNRTDYIDGFTYLNGTLSYFAMPEGRVRNTGTGTTVTLKPEYIISDQQGNARISFEDNGSGVAIVRQENSYYGFGLILPASPLPSPTNDNKQLYNGGSEWQNDYGNLPDIQQTFYRNYDAALGRWLGADPKADMTESLSVYQYANNNPIMFNDPLGDIGKVKTLDPRADHYSGLVDSSIPQAADGFSDVPGFGGGGGGDDSPPVDLQYLSAVAAGVPSGSNVSIPGSVLQQNYAGWLAAGPDGITLTWHPMAGAPISEAQWVALGGDPSTINRNAGAQFYPGAWLSSAASQTQYKAFNKDYLLKGFLYSPSITTNEYSGVSLSTVQTGHYMFLARVSLYMTSPNHWYLNTDLYYIGAKMDNMAINASTFINAKGQNFNSQQFTPDKTVLIPGDWTYVGSSGYTFMGNNTIGNFNLNIHAGAAISTFAGSTAGIGDSNIVVPINKYPSN